MKKYITVKVGSIITQIATPTDIKGYSEGVLEIFYPDDEDYKKWGKWDSKQEKEWINKNNKRMEAICKFLNENNL